MRLALIGLGNYGYLRTRHNTGMEFIDYCIKRLCPQSSFEKEQTDEFVITRFHKKLNPTLTEVCLVKPISYMNTCGKAVKKSIDLIKPDNFIICHDELELNLNVFKHKLRGSANGHNGVKSVINAFNHSDFQRIRIGIGRPESRDDISEYVLSEFSTEEFGDLQRVFSEIYDTLLAKQRFPSGMNRSDTKS